MRKKATRKVLEQLLENFKIEKEYNGKVITPEPYRIIEYALVKVGLLHGVDLGVD